MENVRQLVWKLAVTREAKARDQAAYDALVAQLDAANPDLVGRLAHERREVTELETAIREREYSADSRAPAPGLTVKLVTKLAYDEVEARDWAIANNHGSLLLLDTKAFDKVAGSALAPSFVTVTKVPTVTIARDLTEAAAEIDMALAAEAEAEVAVEAAIAE